LYENITFTYYLYYGISLLGQSNKNLHSYKIWEVKGTASLC